MAGTNSLGRLTLDLIARIGGFTGPLDQAGRVADKRLREIERRAKEFGKALGLAFTAAATAVAVGVKSAIDNADALNDLHIRLGLSAEALSGFAYAAKQSGTDIDALGIGLKKLAKNMAEALDPKSQQATIFKALDLKPIDEATGKLKTLEQFLPEVADKFKGLHDETLEAALAQELFGKSGADLLEFLNLGSSGLDDMQSKLRDLGGELSQDTLSAADQFNDKLDDLHTATNGLFTVLAADLLPHLDQMVTSMIDATKTGSDLRGMVSGLVTVFQYLKETCDGINDTWRGMVSSGIALYNVADNLAKLNPSVALANWITGGGGDSWATNWREAGTAIDQAREKLIDYDKVAQKVTPPKGFGHGIRGGGGKGFGGASPAGAGIDSRALYELLNPPSGGGGGKGGKSDAERQAEQLEEAYKRLHDQMAETIALFGQEGEAAKVRYDIEHGELQKLTGAKQDELLDQAKHIDLLKAEAEEQDRLRKLEEKRQETIKRAHEALADTLSDLQFEIDLLGKSNAQRVAEIELRRIGIGLSAEETAAAKATIEAQAAHLEELHKQIDAMDQVRSSFEDIFTSVLTGQKSLMDGLKEFADSIIQQIARMIAAQASASLFGEPGTQGSGLLGGIFGSLFGGGRASGGSVMPGHLYEVGEHDSAEMLMVGGRQFLIPGNAGSVQPMNGRGGPLIGSMNISVQPGTSRETADQIAAKVGLAVQRAVARNY